MHFNPFDSKQIKLGSELILRINEITPYNDNLTMLPTLLLSQTLTSIFFIL